MGEHEKPATQPELVSWLTPKVRVWLYGVLTCAVPLLIAYGVLDQTQAALWVALGGAVLGLGTAYMHTPGKDYPSASTGSGVSGRVKKKKEGDDREVAKDTESTR